jgi:tetratricopeptide (TPR) repeat protein
MNLTAIYYSPRANRTPCRRLAGWVAALAAFVQIAGAQGEVSSDPKTFTAYAERVLVEARARYHQNPTNAASAWQFGRACFERGEFAADDTERATLAVEGIEAMRRLVEREPKLAAGHYYLAMNLGQFARTKLLGALKIVDEMEREFKAARELQESLDFAGPDRNLGQLYFQAPGWPASIGSRGKARKHLERAVELAPGYPENHLNLLDACCEWKDAKGIRRELKAVEALWPAARTNFIGEAWAAAWADWEKRRSELKARGALFAK